MSAGKIAIAGVGLVGGSLGLALTHLGHEVIGLDLDADTLVRAVARGAISRGSTLPEEVGAASVVILATPLDQLAATAGWLLPHLRPGCIVTDVGSVKTGVVKALEKLLPSSVHYLGGHPMFGTEGQGIEAARANLVEGAAFILTPTAHSSVEAETALTALFSSLKMRVLTLSPEEHDRQVATLSHLPQLIATALTLIAPSTDVAGSSFRDATRVAMSPSAMWRTVFALNGTEVREAVRRLTVELQRLVELEPEALVEALEEARRRRTALPTLPENR